MPAAAVALSEPSDEELEEPSIDVDEIRRGLSCLHLLLLGVKSDASEATGLVRFPDAERDLKAGIKRAILDLEKLREKLGS